MTPAPAAAPLDWDLFCRVIDNLGDLGVCWRLAADLAARGDRVRLWVDRPEPLAWMAPHGASGVTVIPWREPLPAETPAAVVVEAFGCDPPAAFVGRMAHQQPPPVWINLEYLSAEGYVERAHRLPSPQHHGPGAGLTKWFFYPGFSPATGGLLREPDLAARQAASRAAAARRPGAQQHRQALLFCYANPALPGWLDHLAGAARPTGLWITPGPAAEQAAAWLGEALVTGQPARRGSLTLQPLAPMAQTRFDEHLVAAGLNLVRGEDSLVRALWSGRPFVWQIYPQADDAHQVKLAAFLDRYLAEAPSPVAQAVRHWHARWNQQAAPSDRWPAALDWPAPDWQAHARAVAADWSRRPDLTSELRHFALARRAERPG